LIEKRPNRLVVDVGGVGYDVQVPLSTFYQAGEPGGEIRLRVHTHVREDTLALFGFATELEQQIFERLIAVGGIGPKLAIGVLSGIDPHDLIVAVRNADVGRLTAIPGVGKKTAERITLELKDRLPTVLTEPTAAPASPEDGLRADVLSALLNLGYHRPLAEKAIDRSLRAEPAGTFERLLRRTLSELAR
jgi:Holliday junction DNA helicase RuvA